jgi:hypothetical protein
MSGEINDRSTRTAIGIVPKVAGVFGDPMMSAARHFTAQRRT